MSTEEYRVSERRTNKKKIVAYRFIVRNCRFQTIVRDSFECHRIKIVEVTRWVASMYIYTYRNCRSIPITQTLTPRNRQTKKKEERSILDAQAYIGEYDSLSIWMEMQTTTGKHDFTKVKFGFLFLFSPHHLCSSCCATKTGLLILFTVWLFVDIPNRLVDLPVSDLSELMIKLIKMSLVPGMRFWCGLLSKFIFRSLWPLRMIAANAPWLSWLNQATYF